MGFFSSTKIIVSASTVDIISTLPNTIANSAIAARNQDQNIAERIGADLLTGVSNKVQQMYQYALTDYHYGVPEFGYEKFSLGDVSEVEAVVTSIYGPSAVAFAMVTGADPVTKIWDVLCGTYDLDPILGVLGTPFAAFVNPGGLSEDPSKLFLHDVTEINSSTFRITGFYMYVIGITQYFQYHSTTVYKATNITDGESYYHAIYYRLNSDGQVMPEKLGWIYRIDDNTYPQLSPYSWILDNTPFIPNVPMRKNNIDLTGDAYKTGSAYLTSKKMLDIVDLDIDELADSLNESPSIGDIDHAYVVFAASLKNFLDPETRSPGGIEYFYKFLVHGHTQQLDQGVNNAKWTVNHPDSMAPFYNLRINNAGLDYIISFDHLEYNHFSGSIGEIGYTTVDYTAQTGSSFFSGASGYRSTIIFTRQITENRYTRVTVHNLTHTQWIQGRKIVTNVADVMWDDDNNFLIPLDMKYAIGLGLPDRDKLYYQSFKLVCHSYEEIDLGFFSGFFFKIIMLIVMVVVTVLSAGSLSSGLAALYGAAMQGFAVLCTFLLTEVLPMIVMGMIAKLIADLLIEAIGGEAALILSAVVAMASMYFGDVSATFSIGFGEMSISSALLNITNSLITAVSDKTKKDMELLEEEKEDWEDEVDERMDAIAAIQKELELGHTIDPLSLLDTSMTEPALMADPKQPQIIYETPTQFINRTIHPGNIGVLSLSMIGSYVDTALQPK